MNNLPRVCERHREKRNTKRKSEYEVLKLHSIITYKTYKKNYNYLIILFK